MKKTAITIISILACAMLTVSAAYNYTPITDTFGLPKGKPAVINGNASPYVSTDIMLSGPILPYEPTADAVMLYVDADKGNDSNDGSKNKPLLTLAAARDKVREMIQSMSSDIVVNLSGVFVLDETLELTDADGGVNGYKVVYRSADPLNKATISGGSTVTGWTLADAEKNIYVAEVGDIESRDFFVNGKRAQRARTATTYIPYTMHTERTNVNGDPLPSELIVGGHDVEGGFASTDVKWAELKNQSDIEVVQMTSFNLIRYPLSSITVQNGEAFFKVEKKAYDLINQTYSVAIGSPDIAPRIYCLENAYEFMDEPGEWYLDTTADKLYYMAPSGTDMATAETVLGRLERLVTADCTRLKRISNVQFDSLFFRYTTWLQASSDEGLIGIQAGSYRAGTMTQGSQWSQSLWHRQSAAVMFNYANAVHMVNCSFMNLGNTGVDYRSGTQNCNVAGNYFNDLAGSGILLGGLEDKDKNPSERTYKSTISCDNKITDNLIYDIGVTYASECGIVRGYTYRTEISHNTIFNTPYTAISVGWGWGGNELEQATIDKMNRMGGFYTGNVVACNRIDNCMTLLQDGGAIYSLGRQDNHMILGNYITNSHEMGIYMDNGSAGALIKDNVILNTYRNFNLNGGYDVTWTNNYYTRGLSPRNLRIIDKGYTFSWDGKMMSDAQRDSVMAGAGVRKPYSTSFGLD